MISAELAKLGPCRTTDTGSTLAGWSFLETIDYMLASARCLDKLHASGLEISGMVDFELVNILIEEMEKPYLTPVLAPTNHDFTQENAFWLVAWNNEEPAMIIGARLEPLGNESVETYWKRTSRRHYPCGDGETIETVAPEVNSELRGRLAYIGDLFVQRKHRGAAVLLENFMLLAHAAIGLKWDPDFTYAFMRNRDVRLGFANRYGFTRHFPSARVWVNPPDGRSNSEWLVSLPRNDRNHVVRNVLSSDDELRIVQNETVPRKVANR